MACITCLHIFEDNNTFFSDVVIDIELLEDIIPNMDLKFCIQPKVCTECDDKLHQLRNFRNTCDIIENSIRNTIDKVHLTDSNISHKINVLLHRIKSEGNVKITCCRLCLKMIEETSSLINNAKSIKLMIHILVPEVHLDITENPVICDECTCLTEDLYNFYQTYSHVHNVLKEKLQNKKLSSSAELVNIARNLSSTFTLKEIKCEPVEIEEQQEQECLILTNNKVNPLGIQTSPQSKLHIVEECYSRTDKKYRCKECDFITMNRTYFKQHARDKHDDTNWRRCNYCQYRTKRPFSLKQHIFHKHDETKEWFKCDKCEFTSKYKSSLKQHVRSKHTKTDELFTCYQCSYKTSQRRYLVGHFKDVHQTNKNIYMCNFCEHQTKSLMLLKRHVRVKHDKSVPMHQCPHCDHKTKFPYHLKEHIKIFHDQASKVYKCESCDYSTRNITGFRRHNRSKHEQIEEKRFACEHCSFITKHSNSLVIHMKGIHGGGKNHHCPHCEFKTIHISHLKTHVRVKHTPEAKLRCAHCSFTTMYQSSLNKHVKAQHEASERTKCKYCDFETVYVQSLKRHFLHKHSQSEIKQESDVIVKIEEVEVGDTELM